MKKLILITSVFASALFLGQKSDNYYEISYHSMCCGTPSPEPVMQYVENFEKTKKKKRIEVFKQPGLGREGEFNLYLGFDCLSKSKRKKLLEGLEAVIKQQNNSRNKNSDGTVNFSSEKTISKENLTQIKNLTIYNNKESKND